MLLHSVFIGVVATVALDLWALVLKFGFGVQKTNWSMIGRWFGRMRHGQFVHENIADATPVSGERAIGWTAHYVIGIFYAWIYLYIVQEVLSQRPTLLSAIVFGLVTLAAPWFVMQPGLGLGVFARRAPKPWIPRVTSLLAHTIFGAFLYIGWRLAEQLLPA